MKSFKDFNAFKKRIKRSTAWEDYFRMGGKMFHIYEYGGGSMMQMDYDYVYFLNKRTNDMIYVKYNLPNIQYIDGKKQVIGEYRFISAEYLENQSLWR